MKNNKLKVAVFVSGSGTNLQALLDAEEKILQHATISFVLASHEEAYALRRAEKAHLPTKVVVKKDFASIESYEQCMIDILEKEKIDIIVLAGFTTILSNYFIKRFEGCIINVHPSLIPSFCGKGFYGIRVHEAALEKGVKVTGATVHFVNEIPDGGEIIMQQAVRVRKNDNAKSLQKRVMEEAEWKLLPKAVEKVAKEMYMRRENDENSHVR